MVSALLRRRQQNNPVPVYLFLMAGQAVCFSLFFTVQLIYHVTTVELNPFQMVLVGTVLEIAYFLFEIPTGVVADVYSRRLSTLIGIALIGCAYALEGGIPAFWAALTGQVFWALGATFTSGALQAWITDEIGDEAAGPIFLKGRQMWLVGLLVGTLLATVLGVVNIQAPMVLAGAGMFALAASFTFVMPETHMHLVARAERSTFGHMIATARDGYRLAMSRPVVKMIIAISLISGLAAEAYDRLHVPSIINRFDFPTIFGTDRPVVWFGLNSVVGILLGLAGSEIFKRTNRDALGLGSPARLLAACAAIQVGVLVVFTLSNTLWLAFGVLWVRTITNSISQPVELAWLNRKIEPATRATVNSMTTQANSLGQVGGGLALGWVANLASIQAALLASAVVLSPTVALYRRLIVRDLKSVESVPVPAD